MGRGGFDKIESFVGAKNALTDLFTDDLVLPDDYPEQLVTFFHLGIYLSEATMLLIIKNGTAYPLNNNETLEGAIFRSIPITTGDVINFQCADAQTMLQFDLSLEK